MPLKLVEKIILPLTIVICAKLGTIFVLSFLTGQVWNVGPQTSGVNIFFLNFPSYNSLVILINSLSDLAAALVCAAGFTWTLFRWQHLTFDNLHPRHTAAALQKHEYFLTDASNIFVESTVWLSLAFSNLLLSFMSYLTGISSLTIVGFNFAVVLSLGWGVFVETKRADF